MGRTGTYLFPKLEPEYLPGLREVLLFYRPSLYLFIHEVAVRVVVRGQNGFTVPPTQDNTPINRTKSMLWWCSFYLAVWAQICTLWA